MVARAEAVEAVRSANVDAKGAAMSRKATREALVKARLLQPSERRLVMIELATTFWLKFLTDRGPIYPGFEAFLWAYFSRNEGAEQHVYPLMVTGKIGDDATRIYSDYLREMFDASGKTRDQFYGDMCAELGMQASLDSADFGDEAIGFSDKVAGTLHEEHLLVAYSVKLLLKAIMARRPSNSASMADEDLEVVYKHFENSLPLCGKFMKYAKDDGFFNSSLDKGSLSEID